MGIIIKPLVTEKMTAITDKLNRFGFVVRPDANSTFAPSMLRADKYTFLFASGKITSSFLSETLRFWGCCAYRKLSEGY